MSVMSSVMRGARRLVRADPALLSNFPSLPILCPAGSSAFPLTCQQTRKYASKQVSPADMSAVGLKQPLMQLLLKIHLMGGKVHVAHMTILFHHIQTQDVVMCLQVKGQKKDPKNQKVKVKVDKQEVEIKQNMTVASLAGAMNKDFGEKQSNIY